jgi:hypothetical protein
VTCLCLTRNRPEWLPKAIKSFQSQTYRRRELMILADGQDVRHLVPEIIVVDDGVDWIGSDFMLHVRTRAESFHVLPGQKAFIYARNCNIGIRAAGNDDVLLL